MKVPPPPLLPASHQLFVSQKIRDNRVLRLCRPVPRGRHSAQSRSHPVPPPGRIPSPMPGPGGRWQVICTDSVSPWCFGSEALVCLSPSALAWPKLQSKAAESNFCVRSLWCSLVFASTLQHLQFEDLSFHHFCSRNSISPSLFT